MSQPHDPHIDAREWQESMRANKYRHMTLDEIGRDLERARQAGMPNLIGEALLQRCKAAAIMLEVGEGP